MSTMPSKEDTLELLGPGKANRWLRAVLNICFPYTSRAEMTTAIRSTVQEFLSPTPPKNTPFSPSRIRQKILSGQLDGRDLLPTIPDEPLDDGEYEGKDLDDGDDNDSSGSATLPPGSPEPRLLSRSGSYGSTTLPNPDNITVDTIERHIYTADDPPLDLFVRTSGVERLSDFMLWQCHQDTHIFFRKCLWPDFDLKDFIWVLLEWQWRHKQSDREKPSGRAGTVKARSMME